MTESLEQTIRHTLNEVGLGYGTNGYDYEIEVSALAGALAGTLRRAEEYPRLMERVEDLAPKVGLLRHDNQQQAKRVEELEAALRADLLWLRYLHPADEWRLHVPTSCSICEAIERTTRVVEAKP